MTLSDADRAPERVERRSSSRSSASPDSMVATLRALPSLTGTAPSIELDRLPADPLELFREWFDAAVALEVPEPAAMTLSTMDDDGVPDSRTLILKDAGPRGFAFAGTASSRKGRQIAAHPTAALNLWWQPILRAVRIRGEVAPADATECEADLAARSPQARAGIEPGDWRLWWLRPARVEFWQGAVDRQHLRVVYTWEERWFLRISRGETEIRG